MDFCTRFSANMRWKIITHDVSDANNNSNSTICTSTLAFSTS